MSSAVRKKVPIKTARTEKWWNENGKGKCWKKFGTMVRVPGQVVEESVVQTALLLSGVEVAIIHGHPHVLTGGGSVWFATEPPPSARRGSGGESSSPS